MAKTTKPVKSGTKEVVYTSTSVRQISNGFIVVKEVETKRGGYKRTETFSQTNPVKIDNPVKNEKGKKGVK